MDGLVIDDVSMVFTLPNGSQVHALRNVSLHLKPGEHGVLPDEEGSFVD